MNSRTHQRFPERKNHSFARGSMPDRSTLVAFYADSGDLVHRELAAALKPELQQALVCLAKVERDEWGW